jgi:hypothetical protein
MRQYRIMRRKRSEQPQPPADAVSDFLPPVQESQIFAGNASLHDLFQKQMRQTLDQSDLDEEAKQAILVGMNCPCCGAGGMNYTAKIKRRT